MFLLQAASPEVHHASTAVKVGILVFFIVLLIFVFKAGQWYEKGKIKKNSL